MSVIGRRLPGLPYSGRLPQQGLAAAADAPAVPQAESAITRIVKAPFREIKAWSPQQRGCVLGAAAGLGLAAACPLAGPVTMVVGAVAFVPLAAALGCSAVGAAGKWLGRKIAGERGAAVGEKIGRVLGTGLGIAGGVAAGVTAGAVGHLALLPVGFAVAAMCSWAGGQVGRQFTPPQPK